MMNKGIREADWKVFSELRPGILERFCERVLEEMRNTIEETDRNAHDRYLAVYRLLRDRDKELGTVFDTLRRSKAQIQLIDMRDMDLLTDDEFARFSPEIRTVVAKALELRGRHTSEADSLQTEQ